MADDRGWAGAVPELYFDLIGRIPPGLFLSLVLLSAFAPDSCWSKGDLRSPSWTAFILLVVASYSIGLLISPIGKKVNEATWYSSWRRVAGGEAQLLRGALPYLNLDIVFADTDPWGNLTPLQRRLVFRHMHELLKVKMPEARLLLPRLAAELTFVLNFMIAIPIALGILALHWSFVNWPIWRGALWRSPGVYLALLILLLALFSSLYCAKERTEHLVERHFAFLGAYLNDRASTDAEVK